jgi:hypothetical protein
MDASPAAPLSPAALWGRLVAVSALGYAGASPYFADLISRLPHRPQLPVAALVALQGVQVLALAALAAWAGVAFAPRVGLDAPWLSGKERPRARTVLEAVATGTAAALVVAAGTLVLRPLLPESLRAIPPPSRWISVSSAFYGGIIEELLMRWGLLPLAMLGLGRAGLGLQPAFWAANGAVALIFGLGHLPVVRQLHVALTPAVLGYVLVGNGLAGLVFGWLFRRRGLESAMLAHAIADLWLLAVLR